MFHGSARADFKVLESVKTLAQNGILQGLPSHVLKKLLNGGEYPGKQLNDMMSLDLARSLKRSFGMLKIPVKVSGLGGTPTYITSEARVMVTLGGWMAMVYVLDVWLTNIGEG
ncbi:hypothetical protein GQ600_8560 [Phytophthora cactorum]|nr:hypothetical protein GQ600_8560 [Phytophthora cactorum]